MLVDGPPRPYVSGGYEEMLEEIVDVVFDCVRAHKPAIEQRYGPFRVGELGRQVGLLQKVNQGLVDAWVLSCRRTATLASTACFSRSPTSWCLATAPLPLL